MRDGVVLARTVPYKQCHGSAPMFVAVPFASTAPLGTILGLTCVNAQRMKLSTFVTFKSPQRKAPPVPTGHYRPGFLCHEYTYTPCHPANSTCRFPVPCFRCTVSGLRACRRGFRRFLSRVRRCSPAPSLLAKCVPGDIATACRHAAPYILQCSPCQMPTPGAILAPPMPRCPLVSARRFRYSAAV